MNDNGMLSRIRVLVSEKKGLWLIVAVLLLGIVLMIFGDAGDNSEKLGGDGESLGADELEYRVKELCERVRGVSEVSVMITFETAGEQIYAQNTKSTGVGNGGEARVEYVTVSGDVVPIGTVMPRIRGIAVVCRGGDDVSVKLKLTEMLCTLFSVDSNAVSIMGGK